MSELREDEFLLSSAGVEGWNHEVVAGIGLYWRPYDGEKSGFEFKAFGWTKGPAYDGLHSSGGGEWNPWSDPGVTVENVAGGVAFFDGLRHVDFGYNGYMNYPRVIAIALLMNRLAELERDNCRDAKPDEIWG